MKKILFLSLMALFATHIFYSMDQDIPLQPFHKGQLQTQLSPEELSTRLANFEKKTVTWDKTLFGNLPRSDEYFHWLGQNDLGIIIANDQMIERFLCNKNSCFTKIIEDLIKKTHAHYKIVTGDTLEIMMDPSKDQTTDMLNKLPSTIKKYVMEKAYTQIAEPYAIVALETDYWTLDICSQAHLAAIKNKDDSCQMCDLKTGLITTLSMTTPGGSLILSSNGSQLVAAIRTLVIPPKSKIIICDRLLPKEPTHIIEHDNPVLWHLQLDNTSAECSKLTFIDDKKKGFLYDIERGKEPVLQYSYDSRLKKGYRDWDGEPYKLSGKLIMKTCSAYTMCKNAVQNTSDAKSFEKILNGEVYGLLAPIEQDILRAAIMKRKKS
jgi:hypothetical protein